MENIHMNYEEKRKYVYKSLFLDEEADRQFPYLGADETLPVLLLHRLQSMLEKLNNYHSVSCSSQREVVSRIVRTYIQYRDCYFEVFENETRDSLKTIPELRENFKKVAAEIEVFISSNPDISAAD